MTRTILAIATLLASQAHAVSLGSGVVVDAEADRVYLANPEGTIEAVNLDDGQTLWRSDTRGEPLAVSNNLLVAQAETPTPQLELVGLDAKTGQQETKETIQLPKGVDANVADTLGSTFTINAYPLEGRVYLQWNYTRIPMRGVLEETPEEQRMAATASKGSIVYDPRSGEASSIEELPPRALVEPPEEIDPHERLSEDGKHILRFKAIADNRTWDRYEWTVTDRQTGHEVGRIRSYLSQAPFIVDHRTILFTQRPYARHVDGKTEEKPLTLQAVNLETGHTLWSREIHDTTYRGPYPP